MSVLLLLLTTFKACLSIIFPPPLSCRFTGRPGTPPSASLFWSPVITGHSQLFDFLCSNGFLSVPSRQPLPLQPGLLCLPSLQQGWSHSCHPALLFHFALPFHSRQATETPAAPSFLPSGASTLWIPFRPNLQLQLFPSLVGEDGTPLANNSTYRFQYLALRALSFGVSLRSPRPPASPLPDRPVGGRFGEQASGPWGRPLGSCVLQRILPTAAPPPATGARGRADV